MLLQCARIGALARCEELRAYVHAYKPHQRDPFFSLFAYNTLLSAYAKYEIPHKFELVLAEMKERGLKPNIVSYEIAIGLYSRLGDARTCNKYVGELKSVCKQIHKMRIS